MRSSSALFIALLLASGPVAAQDEATAKLDEVEATGKPKQQDDLDTFKLASAHREQAKSVDEKTNGLFQSWVVSICQGCGADLKPAIELKAKDFPNRNVPMTTGAIDASKKLGVTKQAAAPEPRKQLRTSAAADLSPEGLEAIRRMPRQ